MNIKRFLLFAAFASLTCLAIIIDSACNKNKCHNVLCLNRGVCNSGICTCPVGYEGVRCETLSRDKFLFTYNGHDLCGDSSKYTQYSVYFLAVLHDSTEMVIKNFLNNLDDSVICTIQSTDSFTFIGANNSTTFTGYGHLSNDSLHMAYHVEHDTIQYDCKYFGQSLR
jgi:hypothetical protein